MSNRSLAEVVSLVLQRIAKHRYQIEARQDGEVIVVRATQEPTIGEMEDYFQPDLGMVKLGHEISEDSFSEAEWNDKDTAALCESAFGRLGKDFVAKLKFELRGKGYEEVIRALYAVQTGLRDPVRLGRTLMEGRENLSSQELSEADAILRRLADELVNESVASVIATRLGHRFPKFVRRAEKLEVLPSSKDAPGEVKRYLSEATGCHVYGHYVACVLVCRSALEFAVRDRLERRGCQAELDELRRNRRLRLESLIDLAREKLSHTLKPTLDLADDVRERANKAVHVRPPTQEESQEVFEKTRGVLKELYA